VKHTVEPWAAGVDQHIKADEMVIGHFFSPDDLARAVACVNACAGLSDEELESITELGGVKVHMETLEAEIDAQ